METNIVYQEDCIEGMKKIPSNSIDLVLTDPPYLTTKEEWDKKEVVNNDFVLEIQRILKNSGSLYIFCGIGEKSQSLIRWFPIINKNLYFKDIITWKKQRGIGMRKGWLYAREELLWFVKDNNNFIWNKKEQYLDEKRKKYGFSNEKGIKTEQLCNSEFKRISNVWVDINESTFDGVFGKSEILNRLHFTPKPVKIMERIIKSHTKEGDVVLDCFGGSGTTAIACIETNRKYIMFENNPQYFKIINNRIKSEKSQTQLSNESCPTESLICVKEENQK